MITLPMGYDEAALLFACQFSLNRSAPANPPRSRGLGGSAVSGRWFATVLTVGLSLIGVQYESALAAEPPTLAQIKDQYRRPSTIPFPAENPYTAAKAKL